MYDYNGLGISYLLPLKMEGAQLIFPLSLVIEIYFRIQKCLKYATDYRISHLSK